MFKNCKLLGGSRMGMLSTLRGYNIRFNPRPWLNSQPTTTKPVKTQVLKPQVVKTKTVPDKSFVDLHLDVAKKVDALIEQMEAEGKFDDWEAPSAKSSWIAKSIIAAWAWRRARASRGSRPRPRSPSARSSSSPRSSSAP